jgi:thiol-disulfide isomerase/thioredoxin
VKRITLCFILPTLILAGCGKRLPTVVQQSSDAAPRRVVMELFTATWCPNCPTSDAALEKLSEEMGDSLTVIEYHPLTGSPLDPFGNSESEARGDFYGVDAWPTLWCDGLTSQIGTSLDTYKGYSTLAHNRILLNSPIQMDLKARIEGGILGYDVSLRALEQIAAGDPRLLVLVLEDSIFYSAPNGLKTHRFVCRDIEPDASGSSVSLTPGLTVLKQGSILIDTSKWRSDRLWVAAFVQDNKSKEILQSDFVNLSEPVWDFSLASADTIETVGVDSIAKFSFKIKNTGNQLDTFWMDLPDSLAQPDNLNRILKDSLGNPLSLPYPLVLAPGDSVNNFMVEMQPTEEGDYFVAMAVRSNGQPSLIKKINFCLNAVNLIVLDFSLTATDSSLSTSVWATAEYSITVTNTGNQADSIWLDIPDSLLSSGFVSPALCDLRGICYPLPYARYLTPGATITNLVVHLTAMEIGSYEASLTLTSKSDPLLVRRLRLYLEAAK